MARFNTNEDLLRVAKTALDNLAAYPATDPPLTRDEAADCFVAAFLAFTQDACDDFATFGEALIDVALLGAEMSATLQGE